MTREERLKLLKQIEIDIYVPSIESTLLDDAKSCAIHSVIEELEQEPVIRDNGIKDELNRVEDELEHHKQNIQTYAHDFGVSEEQAEKELAVKNDLGVDCISREQAKIAIRDKFKDLPLRVEINTILNELPSVTPQPRKGHWISHREHCENLGVMPSGLSVYEWCSNCDCGIDVREWYRNHYNFCPNCGADMRGEE